MNSWSLNKPATSFLKAFHKVRFHQFAKELLNGFNEYKAAAMTVPHACAPHVRSCVRFGTYESPDGELADVLIVHTTEPWKLERARTALCHFVAHKQLQGSRTGRIRFAMHAFVALCPQGERIREYADDKPFPSALFWLTFWANL